MSKSKEEALKSTITYILVEEVGLDLKLMLPSEKSSGRIWAIGSFDFKDEHGENRPHHEIDIEIGNWVALQTRLWMESKSETPPVEQTAPSTPTPAPTSLFSAEEEKFLNQKLADVAINIKAYNGINFYLENGFKIKAGDATLKDLFKISDTRKTGVRCLDVKRFGKDSQAEINKLFADKELDFWILYDKSNPKK